MRWFFDNCVSPKLARALNILVQPEHEVVALRDKWPQADTKTIEDVFWIQTLGKEQGWVVVSGDLRIRSHPAESAALRSAKLTTFFLAKGYADAAKWEQVRWLVDKWPEMADLAKRVASGGMFRVPRRGKVETL